MIKRKKEMKLQHANPFPHPDPTLFSSLTLHSSLKTASRQRPCPHLQKTIAIRHLGLASEIWTHLSAYTSSQCLVIYLSSRSLANTIKTIFFRNVVLFGMSSPIFKLSSHENQWFEWEEMKSNEHNYVRGKGSQNWQSRYFIGTQFWRKIIANISAIDIQSIWQGGVRSHFDNKCSPNKKIIKKNNNKNEERKKRKIKLSTRLVQVTTAGK